MTTAATVPSPMSDVATGLKMGVYAAHASGLWFILLVTTLRLERGKEYYRSSCKLVARVIITNHTELTTPKRLLPRLLDIA